jgi:hypothetical protein
MKCPNARDENGGYCPSTFPLEVHNTDQYSTYYCQGCGYEEKVVWPTPVKTKRQIFNEPSSPRRKKVVRRDR